MADENQQGSSSNSTAGYDANKHFNIFDTKLHTTLNTHRAVRNDIRTVNQRATGLTGPEANTMALASTNITVYANGSIVGMIQSLSVTESRNVTKLQCVGWEGVVQAVPDNYKGGSLNVSRFALYESNIWNALGLTSDGMAYNQVGSKYHNKSGSSTGAGQNATQLDKYTIQPASGSAGLPVSSGLGFRTLKDQRVPLEIQVKTAYQVEDVSNVETYIDCWLSSYGSQIGVGSITVTESATIMYGDVY